MQNPHPNKIRAALKAIAASDADAPVPPAENEQADGRFEHDQRPGSE